MEQAKQEQLYLELKEEKLAITWDDPSTTKKLHGIIVDAELALNHKLGAEIDYSAPGMEHGLFLNYCLYVYNDVAFEFDQVYQAEIYQLRHIQEVKRRREELANETTV